MSKPDSWFDELYTRNKKRLLGMAYHALWDRELAEDLTQDTFMVALAKREQTENHENPDAYLTLIMRNRIGNEMQRASRKREILLEAEHERFLAVEDKERVEDLLPNWMDEQERSVIILRAEYGLSYKEMGEKLGLSERACEAKMYRLRVRFKKFRDQ